jgi:hypothetical protein
MSTYKATVAPSRRIEAVERVKKTMFVAKSRGKRD